MNPLILSSVLLLLSQVNCNLIELSRAQPDTRVSAASDPTNYKSFIYEQYLDEFEIEESEIIGKSHLFHNYRNKICHPTNSTLAHLNKGKSVINVNSINDEIKSWPLMDALSKGFRSVETGVWLLDCDNYGEQSSLYVGENNLQLAPGLTLDNLYLTPLEKLIDEQNCKENPVGETACDFNGVFYDSPDETFIIYLELHTEAISTYTVLLTKLRGLINSEYLTHYDYEKDELIKGPITVVLTGTNIPFEEIVGEEEHSFYGDKKRYVFIDAPLDKFGCDEDLHLDYSKLSVTSGGSLESVSGCPTFETVEGGLSNDQKEEIDKKVKGAHEFGLLTRVYCLPEFPKTAKLKIYTQLIDQGVDILNVVDNDDVYLF